MELFSNGVKLDLSDDKFGKLKRTNAEGADLDALLSQLAEDGYLFLPQYISNERVSSARNEIMLKFAIAGEVNAIDHCASEGIQSDDSFIDQVNLVALSESIRTGKSYNDLVDAAELYEVLENVLGGDVVSFDFKWPRFVRPGECTGFHSDIVYIGRGTRDLLSAWIPIGDVPMSDGPLLILEGSHKSTKLSNYWEKDADKDKIGWLSTDPIALQQSIGGRWLTEDFVAGDVIIFSPFLVHGSLDNNSSINRCRLSSDTRYQLKSQSLDDRWNGDVDNPHETEFPTAFLPGLAKTGNREFSEEWKRVDDKGRLYVG